MSEKARLKNFYTPLLLLALALAGIGLVNLYSATVTFGDAKASSYFINQFLYHFCGIAAMVVLSRLPAKMLRFAAPVAYFTAVVLLLLVLVRGRAVHGSLSWLEIGGFRLQPSEFAKVGLILMLSRHLAAFADRRHALGLSGLVRPALITGLPMVLVLLQKDLGSSLFFALIFTTLVLLQGVRWHLVVAGIVIVGLGGIVAYKFLMMPYQQKRIVSFMNPELDARGSGYHLVQSKIAVGSGGLWGRGYLRGASNKLNFLPERHTDFIFPVLAEEWGFVGSVVTLLLYMLFLLYGANVASRARDRFGFFLGVGMTSLFFWHIVINLGGVLGLIPLTGVPLPFLSYGGSALLADWGAVGILLALYRGRVGYSGFS